MKASANEPGALAAARAGPWCDLRPQHRPTPRCVVYPTRILAVPGPTTVFNLPDAVSVVPPLNAISSRESRRLGTVTVDDEGRWQQLDPVGANACVDHQSLWDGRAEGRL
jgi:hypothetical protein